MKIGFRDSGVGGAHRHARSPEAGGMTLQSTEPDLPLRGVRIALVEDSWHVAQALQALLTRAGAEILGATATVAGARQLLETDRPDIAIIDINLGGEITFDVVDHLGELGLPAVVVTGYGAMPELEGRVTAVLEKPVRAADLIAAVSAALARKV